MLFCDCANSEKTVTEYGQHQRSHDAEWLQLVLRTERCKWCVVRRKHRGHTIETRIRIRGNVIATVIGTDERRVVWLFFYCVYSRS